jgi:hypothetical protein
MEDDAIIAGAEKASEAAAPELGLLDLTVRLSTREITAGKQFAVFVLVKNPFRKPVWIERVHVSLPSELVLAHDADHAAEMAALEQKERQSAHEKEAQQTKLLAKIDALTKSIDMLSKFGTEGNDPSRFTVVERKVRELMHELSEDSRRGPEISVGNLRHIQNLRIVSAMPRLSMSGAEEGIRIQNLEIIDPQSLSPKMASERTVTLKSSLPPNAPLYPSSTAVYTVLLDVRRSFIFPPSTYLLQFSANFSFDPLKTGEIAENSRLQTNTAAFEISIRPSIYSLIGGAVIGGITGSLARLLKTSSGFSASAVDWNIVGNNSLAIGLAAILSAVAIIFVARKSDTQSFISVEDFWGGLLTGFFVGYTGTEFFSQLTNKVITTPVQSNP